MSEDQDERVEREERAISMHFAELPPYPDVPGILRIDDSYIIPADASPETVAALKSALDKRREDVRQILAPRPATDPQ